MVKRFELSLVETVMFDGILRFVVQYIFEFCHLNVDQLGHKAANLFLLSGI